MSERDMVLTLMAFVSRCMEVETGESLELLEIMYFRLSSMLAVLDSDGN